MTKTFRAAALVAIIAVIAGALAYYFITPAKVKKEIAETGAVVDKADVRTDQFDADVKEHKVQTETKVVVIRDVVAKEIGALDPDGLAAAALVEIELWRGGSGSEADPRPPGVGSQGGGVLP
jgi:PBP1b-binding outer membrane lipoprotein LpoB